MPCLKAPIVLLVFLTVVQFGFLEARRQKCGDRWCVQAAECVDGKCVCPPSAPYGMGYFQCYESQRWTCEIWEDPRVRVFPMKSPRVWPLPDLCRYPVSCVRLRWRGRNPGKCQVQVFGAQMKYRGKLYVYSFEICIQCRVNRKRYCLCLKYKVWGRNKKRDRVRWQRSYKKSCRANVPYRRGSKSLDIDGHVIAPSMTRDGFVVVKSKEAGFSAGFRPYIHRLRKTRPGGIFFHLNPEARPRWCRGMPGICLKRRFPVSRLAKALGVSPQNAIWYSAMTSGVEQLPESSPAIKKVSEILKKCDSADADTSMTVGAFMYTNSNFTRCYDTSKNGNGLVTLFAWFLRTVCDGNVSGCEAVQKKVKMDPRGCGNYVPDFYNFDCGSLGGP